ncbi:MAG: SDR family oxidoreductase [Gammaproteobacteria bacterium]|uniref:Aldehyde reductase n=1 Tax=SAR86 cluster bacterium TaxID=2030880 RepID=A0A520MS05_9GAMM|nr:MAG: aldehyde reductase [SAR86 cluster bacterium]|tara:strand:- start:1494 stop:2489 length:996 start_codon:yes stop_codon:yes gene_type:complete
MKKALLTGISGYIAMHCAKELLKRDYHINATVRNLDKVEDIKNALSALSLDVNKIQFFQADLLSDDNWEDAMADCEYVMHVASPYPLNQPKDESVLIKPAVEGTERVVSLAIKNNVKKIVLTSSVVAVSVGHTKKEYSEEDWSFADKPIAAYAKSKTLAEKKAWELIKNADTDTKLTVINPSGVIGPSLTSEISSTQLIIAGLMNGKIPVNLPIHIGYVDVRDVALAHIKALENPNSDGERIILSNTELWHKDVSKILKEGGYKAPWLTVSVPVAKFLANVVPALKGAKRFLGKDMVKNSTKAEDILGISYIDIKKSILDDAKSLTEFEKV